MVVGGEVYQMDLEFLGSLNVLDVNELPLNHSCGLTLKF